MKKFFAASYKLMAFDTESNTVSTEGSSVSERTDYVFQVTEDGEFIGDNTITVKAGDIVAILYPNDDSEGRKIAIYGSQEHINHMMEAIELRKKRDAERAANQSEDICCAPKSC